MLRIHRSSKRHDVRIGKEKSLKKILFTLVALLVVGGIIWVLHRPSLSIQTVSVVGGQTINVEKIEDIVEGEIEGSYIGVFPKRSVFLYPKQEILSLLVAREPKIEHVSIRAPFGDFTTLYVMLEERNSNLLWCARLWCARLDEDGTLFEEAPSATEDFFVIRDDRAPRQGLGSVATTQEVLKPIFIMKSSLKRDLVLQEALILPEGDYSLITEEGTEIRFNKDDDLSVVADNLFTLFRSNVIEGNATSSLSDWLVGVEYIDARFGKKIFYKER